MFDDIIHFIRDLYRTELHIPLHAPLLIGNERSYVDRAITSTYVSSVGAFVDQLEDEIAAYTGVERAVAVVNGTAALHVAMLLAGVKPGDCVITQALTFVATCNAIAYCGAQPVFVDVDRDTMGLSVSALEDWLESFAEIGADGLCRRRSDRAIVRACVPMHTFGHIGRVAQLVDLCRRWGIAVVEDAAEALGSTRDNRHAGTFGDIGVFSFNGNKILTTGGGGIIVAKASVAARAKHLTTTAKTSHSYEYVHDQVGYNYRMPNLNAALGCAQLEQLDDFVAAKRALASAYADFFADTSLEFFVEPSEARSNYWLNAVLCESRAERDALLHATNDAGISTRPIWSLMTRLPMYENADRGDLTQSEWLEDRVVNLPSSVVPAFLEKRVEARS